MKTKLALLFAMILLVVLATTVAPPSVEAACSGVNCGCDVDQQWCIADCPPEGAEGWLGCRLACLKAYRECALACCGGW